MATFGINRLNWSSLAALDVSARAAEQAGFGALWFPDNQLRIGDVFANVLAAGRATEHSNVGTLTVNPVTRHSTVLAGSISAVARELPGRVLLGIGIGDTAVHQAGLRPARLAELESTVRTVRSLLAGDGVEMGWRERTTVDGARSAPVIVAASGPKTLRMAGRSADGAVIRVGTDPELIRWAYGELAAGAREAGRDPATLFVALHFHTVLSDEPDVVTARARVMAAGYYEVNRGLWEYLGIPWTLPALTELQQQVVPDFHHAVDMAGAAELVKEMPIETALRFCIAGDGPACRSQVERIIRDAPWANHVILQPNIVRGFAAAAGEQVVKPLRGVSRDG
ncbi:MAG: LLM class flavin-dependent oxidoreductase [Dehalococcoidia bacterium]